MNKNYGATIHRNGNPHDGQLVRRPHGRRGKRSSAASGGRLRLKGVRSTNPVVVGDRVVCEWDEENAGVICEVLPRRNYIIRRASNLSKESHIIAANLDRALLVVTLFSPVTAPEFIDRFLVTCEAYRVPVTILLAKADLTAQNPEAVAAFKATYENAGYSVLEFSAFDGTGIEPCGNC